MRRRPICKRCRSTFHDSLMRGNRLSGISRRFRQLSRSCRQVAYVLLTRPPLTLPRRSRSARLACIRHAASVRPEPGSNSPKRVVRLCSLQASFLTLSDGPKSAERVCARCSVFKEQAFLTLDVGFEISDFYIIPRSPIRCNIFFYSHRGFVLFVRSADL